MKSIARVCSALVPLMALCYVVGCVYILCVNADYLWPALKLIVQAAFEPSAAGGGFVGAGVMMAARYGIARGLFSNESGLGSAPIVAAAAQTRNPVRQALVSSSGTFWDTVVICALTGMVIVSSIIAYPDIDFSNGATLTKDAFSKIPVIGTPLLTFGPTHFLLLHHPRLVLLWRACRGVSQGQEVGAAIPRSLHRGRIHRQRDESGNRMEPG